MQDVGDLDGEAGSVYWGMQQCGKWAWALNQWGQESVLDCGTS